MNRQHIEEKIEEYRKGLLSEPQIEELWSVIIAEPEYQDYLLNLINLEKTREAPSDREDVAEERTSILDHLFFTWKKTAVASILILSVSIGYFFTRENDTQQVTPLYEIELNVFRSTHVPSGEFEYLLKQAVNDAAELRYYDALETIDKISKENLSDEKRIHLYTTEANILYNAGYYQEAINRYKKILAGNDSIHETAQERIHWYLANAYLKSDELPEALHHATITAHKKGAFSRPAQHLVKTLSE
ncbi:hypothetical protein QLX67_03505 [Balneolaceae bacterium ANBcel3]|nr:hypothetical protein [Balneolaceae bacterium ANBcel3]